MFQIWFFFLVNVIISVWFLRTITIEAFKGWSLTFGLFVALAFLERDVFAEVSLLGWEATPFFPSPPLF